MIEEKGLKMRNPSITYDTMWLYAAQPDLKEFQSNETTGKWCIFRHEDEIDDLWNKIAILASKGEILLAKCSTALNTTFYNIHAKREDRTHIICVYTNDWSDKDDLLKVRKVLRSIGVAEEIGYKRDIDTRAGKYGCEDEFILKC